LAGTGIVLEKASCETFDELIALLTSRVLNASAFGCSHVAATATGGATVVALLAVFALVAVLLLLLPQAAMTRPQAAIAPSNVTRQASTLLTLGASLIAERHEDPVER
jgi:hypothetical protein